jgi:proteasome accessory factor A
MEWSTLVQIHPGCKEQLLSSQMAESFFREQLPPSLSRIGQFCSNGARLYDDIGQHPEYATPEDASLMGTVANEIAGERILEHVLDSAKEKKALHKFMLNKRVVDEFKNGYAWGYHENYLAPAHYLDISEEGLALLGIHLATRNILVGAGGLRRDRNTGSIQYFLAQKALNLNADFSGDTTRVKPVVNLRQEPHAASEVWRRVHVTSGDPNMSPWATFMKLGTTSLVLRLIENGEKLEQLRVASLTNLAKKVAADLSLCDNVLLRDGTTIRPIGIQEKLCAAAWKLGKEIALPDEELLVISEWQKALDDAKEDPMLLWDRSDWVAKKLMLEAYADRHDLRDNDPDLFKKDRQWDNIGPHGIGIKLRKKHWANWMPTEEFIADRMFTPPDNTRAILRGKFIKRFAKDNGIFVSWSSVKVNNHPINLPNPYNTNNSLIAGLLGEEVA